ncbi:MAG: hypothetical protein IT384_00005 [Deltaproteobacteria bacterium]|nr:hypothetical protein [Deltaproteobacteria bacterium]
MTRFFAAVLGAMIAAACVPRSPGGSDAGASSGEAGADGSTGDRDGRVTGDASEVASDTGQVTRDATEIGGADGEPIAVDAGGEDAAAADVVAAGDAQVPDGGRADAGPSDASTNDSGIPQPDDLPHGSTGIASRYAGDNGIGSDPAVVFADGFETYTQVSQLSQRWTGGVYHTQNLRIATETANVFSGTKAIEVVIPQGRSEVSNALDQIVSPEPDVLFLRYYDKFEAPFDVVGSSHNGAFIASHYFDNGATPGVPADGTNKFLVSLEHGRESASEPRPGFLNIYIYHPAQRDVYGDHFFPDGTVIPFSYLPGDFGPTFVPRPSRVPDLDRWYCHELMVKANTPGLRDGRIAIWEDGEIVADFPNMRLRDVPSLTINRFQVVLHARDNPNGVARKWIDNVVAATSYIGPLSP